MAPPPPSPIGLAELEGVRRLARVLVHGDADADDLAQDAVLVALTRPPSPGYAPRAWLAGIARRLARNRHRERARRARHEGRFAAEASRAAPMEVGEHLERRRWVLEAMAALPEESAQVLCLRYFDDLPPRAIAARLGLPVETVRTRTKRALARLRDRLDARQGGDRGAWTALLMPLVPAPSAPPVPGVTEGVAMASTTKLAAALAAALLLAGGGYAAWRARGAASGSDAPRAGTATAALPFAPAGLEGRPRGAPSSAAAASGPASPPVARADRPADGGVADGAAVSGRVLGPDGAPIAGARVRTRPQSALPGYLRIDLARRWSLLESTTDADGRWTLRGIRPGDGYALVVDAPDLAPTFAAASWRAREVATVADLTLASGVIATGRVVDADGHPLPAARIAVLLPETNPLGFVLASIDAHPMREALATTDPAGRFRLEHLEGPTLVLVVEHPGHATLVAKRPVGAGPVTALDDLVLPADGSLSGHARFGDGTPAVGARVLVTRDDDASAYAADVAPDGAFRIGALPPGTAPVIGFLPGLSPVFGPPARTGDAGIELRFPRPGRLVGRVVNATDGTAIPRFRVRPVPTESAPDFLADFAEKAVTDVLGPLEVSDPEGRFTLDPIEPRTYRVEVEAAGFAAGSAGPVEVPPAGAGAPVEVRLATAGSLTGVVVGAAGTPVAGASLLAEAGGTSWASPPAPKTDGVYIALGPQRPDPVAVASGADGGFAFPPLPAGPQALTVRAPGYAPWFRAGIDLGSLREPLHVALERGGSVAGQLTVAGASPETIHHVLLVGADGTIEGDVGERGEFRVEHIPSGRWLLLPSIGTPVPALLESARDELARTLGAGDVVVGDGAEARRNLAVASLGSILVRAPATDGNTTLTFENVSAQRVRKDAETGELEFAGPFVHVGTKDADGSASVHDLLPGTYQVTAFYSTKGRDAAGHDVQSYAQAKVVVEVTSDPRPAIAAMVPPK